MNQRSSHSVVLVPQRSEDAPDRIISDSVEIPVDGRQESGRHTSSPTLIRGYGHGKSITDKQAPKALT
ncbi:hypothetical protein T265_05869 [Opisthorchis viverrini]|uniref:Uncharacterized protein n=1 Tax=Opisthorchis viverrini TaxID=6198 RepID=A0A074ZU82_OPIVI|nr:hypothetical protein T265_05869 [Opisthorchis viverrini]KER26960.1 hypothetical protein T265_05869 [Opisthorchis viverrini]